MHPYHIDSLIQGSLASTVEPYIKPNPDMKAAMKVHKSARSYCSLLGRYRMPFAWTSRPLFRPTGELDTTSDFTTIFRQEVHRNSELDLLKILNDFRKFVL